MTTPLTTITTNITIPTTTKNKDNTTKLATTKKQQKQQQQQQKTIKKLESATTMQCKPVIVLDSQRWLSTEIISCFAANSWTFRVVQMKKFHQC